MENHHFWWENPLFLWPFSIAMLVHQRVVIGVMVTNKHWRLGRNPHPPLLRNVCGADIVTSEAQPVGLAWATTRNTNTTIMSCWLGISHSINMLGICIYIYVYIYIYIPFYKSSYFFPDSPSNFSLWCWWDPYAMTIIQHNYGNTIIWL